MELLPDLALLAVFSRLDTGQLLRARGVCRRWRDLALSPQLWAVREVRDDDRLLEAALQLAPRLRVLDLRHCWDVRPGLQRAALTTRCAAGELRLFIQTRPSLPPPGIAGSLLWALQVLDKQEALGRLRTLRLEWQDVGAFVPMHMSLVNRAGLEVLEVCNQSHFLSPARFPEQPHRWTTRLRQLLWTSYSYEEEPLLGSLLEAHADTLEVAEVRFLNAWRAQFMAPLSRCPGLRRLRVPLCPELAAFDVRRLTDLKLDLPRDLRLSDEEAKELVAGLAAVLSSATRLEKMTLLCDVAMGAPLYWVLVCEVVRALAASDCPALRELRCRMDYAWWTRQQLLTEMRAAPLPRLPRLHTLELPCVPSPDLLEAVSASGLPLVIIRDQLCSREACALPWVRELLAARPRLHVKAQAHYAHGSCTKACRGCCARVRHPQLRGRPASAFYSHPEEEPCDLHSGGLWVRLR